MGVGAHGGQKRAVTVVVSHQTWVLGIKLGSFGRIGVRGAIAPALHFILEANEVKVLATKPENPSSTPGTHRVEGKK